MDSQGFVSLLVIGNFKRIASLTSDMELLRISAFQSKTIELRQGDDGEDRLRRREGWEQWVMSNMEERDPAARNAGPSAQSHQPRRPAYAQYPSFAESPYPMNGPMRSPSWGMPGYNDVSGVMSPAIPHQGLPDEHGRVERATSFQASGSGMNGDRRNSAMPPAAPQGHSRSSSFVRAINGAEPSNLPNGHTGVSHTLRAPSPDQENVFPNEKVSSIWVYARKGEDDAPPFASQAPRTFSHGSRGTLDLSGNLLTSPQLISGLRGGAGSPEQ